MPPATASLWRRTLHCTWVILDPLAFRSWQEPPLWGRRPYTQPSPGREPPPLHLTFTVGSDVLGLGLTLPPFR